MRIYPWLICVLCYSSGVIAFPTVIPDPIPCVLKLETGFFTEGIVSQALSMYNVRQELWVLINDLLQQKSQEVPDRMKRRTAYMVPNPIEYPMQKGATAKILKDVLFDVFNEVMMQYHTDEILDSKSIFDYIFSRRFGEFEKCFGPEIRDLKPKDLI